MQRANFLVTILVALLVITSVTLLTISGANQSYQQDEQGKHEEDLPVIRVIELKGENIIVRGASKTIAEEGNKEKTAIIIYDYMFFKDPSDVDAYIKRKKALLEGYAKKWPSLRVLAILNPIEPLNWTQYIELGRELIKKYNLTILSIRFRSYPCGGGILGVESGAIYPSGERIKVMEENIAKRMNTTFSLIDTIIGIVVEGELRNLVKLQEHTKISLVDIGPLELAFSYLPKEGVSKIEVMIHSRFETALLAYDSKGELFFVVEIKPSGFLIEHVNPRTCG